ncbi:MAG: 3-methyl-2-oxobutanoate hydroxymethyltransferase [Acidobacteriaceae bacterium]|nr:3-methyl-2-oxobutanoate hydroxymethyltransferase [Acidobacteriaceae bacterium]
MNKSEKPVRVPDIQTKKNQGEKITMLTAYSAWMARLLAAAGIDMLLVGDSLGMVELGYDSTLPVTMGDMLRHCQAVRRGAPNALVIADMPFLSHQLSAAQALRNAGRLIQEGEANAVKIEGGEAVASTIQRIVDAGIPVQGHVGLTPQSINVLGGFRRQGKRPEEQERLLADAAALEAAGAFSIVLECVPDELARAMSEQVRVPVIGIGSGPYCDGQILVTHDILGLTGPLVPAFAKHYAELGGVIKEAAEAFASEVRARVFPPGMGKEA